MRFSFKAPRKKFISQKKEWCIILDSALSSTLKYNVSKKYNFLFKTLAEKNLQVSPIL